MSERESTSANRSTSQQWTEGPRLAGCEEWRLSNGLRLILLEDHSQPSITVNNTILVGSRHERRGERGMAHFLEHMLFKGTKTFDDIPAVLRERGAKFNGTTWLDRTHYYEVLPASSENLSFAIQLEAERMSTVQIETEPFQTEREVIRNELLRGENNPSRVLFQRLLSTAFTNHGYGHPTIGFMTDLDGMTADDLRKFYHDFYVPRRAVLVVAGDFDTKHAMDLVEEHFGMIEDRSSNDQRAYERIEPIQDGERAINLRRIAEVNEVAIAYRIPPASSHEFVALRMLALVLGMRPTGRLYRELVENGKCSETSSMLLSLHDPGLLIASADIPVAIDVEDQELKLIENVEQQTNEISDTELSRAKNEILKRQLYERADSGKLAIALTESIAQGDWQLHFRMDDQIQAVTTTDLQNAAAKYLLPTNRTTARLVASKQNEQVEISLTKPDSDVARRAVEISSGEPFVTNPRDIESKISRQTLGEQFRGAFLNRRTRADLVSFVCQFRIGNESTGFVRAPFVGLFASWLMRGTLQRSYVDLQDQLRAQKAWLSASGFRGGITFEGQVGRDQLMPLLELLKEVAQEPLLPKNEFELLKRSTLARIDQQRTQPATLAANQLRRILENHPADDCRHIGSLDEQKEEIEGCDHKNLQARFQDVFGGGMGECVLVGPDVDDAQLTEWLSWLGTWKPVADQKRVAQDAQSHEGQKLEIDLPGKANIGLSAGCNLHLSDRHEEFAALVLANYVFGGATLTSRLSREVRGRRGLSYSIHSSFWAHAVDHRARLSIHATTNPENRQELITTIEDELQAFVTNGVTTDEIERAKSGLLATRRVDRANSRNLADMIALSEFANRGLDFVANVEESIQQLNDDHINTAIAKHLDPNRLVLITAGELGSVS